MTLKTSYRKKYFILLIREDGCKIILTSFHNRFFSMEEIKKLKKELDEEAINHLHDTVSCVRKLSFMQGA